VTRPTVAVVVTAVLVAAPITEGLAVSAAGNPSPSAPPGNGIDTAVTRITEHDREHREDSERRREVRPGPPGGRDEQDRAVGRKQIEREERGPDAGIASRRPGPATDGGRRSDDKRVSARYGGCRSTAPSRAGAAVPVPVPVPRRPAGHDRRSERYSASAYASPLSTPKPATRAPTRLMSSGARSARIPGTARAGGANQSGRTATTSPARAVATASTASSERTHELRNVSIAIGWSGTRPIAIGSSRRRSRRRARTPGRRPAGIRNAKCFFDR